MTEDMFGEEIGSGGGPPEPGPVTVEPPAPDPGSAGAPAPGYPAAAAADGDGDLLDSWGDAAGDWLQDEVIEDLLPGPTSTVWHFKDLESDETSEQRWAREDAAERAELAAAVDAQRDAQITAGLRPSVPAMDAPAEREYDAPVTDGYVDLGDVDAAPVDYVAAETIIVADGYDVTDLGEADDPNFTSDY